MFKFYSRFIIFIIWYSCIYPSYKFLYLNLCHIQTRWLRLCRGQWASAQVGEQTNNKKWKMQFSISANCCVIEWVVEYFYIWICNHGSNYSCHPSLNQVSATQTSLSEDEQFADCLHMWELLEVFGQNLS